MRIQAVDTGCYSKNGTNVGDLVKSIMPLFFINESRVLNKGVKKYVYVSFTKIIWEFQVIILDAGEKCILNVYS